MHVKQEEGRRIYTRQSDRIGYARKAAGRKKKNREKDRRHDEMASLETSVMRMPV